MELTLFYRGSLPPTQRGVGRVKADLRREFAPQIEAQVAPRMSKAKTQAATTVGTRTYISPAHPNLETAVELNVLMLTPAGLANPGDTDNRLKTLIDGLTRPQQNNQTDPGDGDGASPTYCLLDNDNLVSRVSLDSRELHGTTPGEKSTVLVVTAKLVLSSAANMSSSASNLWLVL